MGTILDTHLKCVTRKIILALNNLFSSVFISFVGWGGFYEFLLDRFFIVNHRDNVLNDISVVCLQLIVILGKTIFVLSQKTDIH